MQNDQLGKLDGSVLFVLFGGIVVIAVAFALLYELERGRVDAESGRRKELRISEMLMNYDH